MNQRRRLILVFAVAILAVPFISAQEHARPSAEEIAKYADDPSVKAAVAWLTLVDAHKYEESWTEAANLFRTQVERDAWVDSLKRFREPMGANTSRSASRVEYSHTLRGAPDGEYSVLHFRAAFVNKENVTERVTLVKQEDGWKVSAFALH